jgi:hypothetical protein
VVVVVVVDLVLGVKIREIKEGKSSGGESLRIRE